MLVRLAFFTFCLSAGAPALAQGARPVPTALPFLDLTPSPGLVGLGGAGVAQPGAGAHAALANPALVGLAARDVIAATATGPGASEWRGFGDIRLTGGAQSAGLDGLRLVVPLSAGASVSWGTMAYGDQVLLGSAETYEPTDEYRALSLGAATRGPLRAALGGTIRNVSSTDRAVIVDGMADVSRRSVVTADFGLALAADVAAVAGNPTVEMPRVGDVRPALEITAGYAQAHIGGRMRYSGNDWQALPRTARLGWGAVAGLDVALPNAGAVRAVEFEFASQAETRLVREPSDGEYSYARALGDVDALDALIGRGDASVTGRRGLRLAALETVSFSWGIYGGGGFGNVRAHAVEFRLAGPLKALAALTASPRIAGMARRFDLRWTRAVTYVGSSFETALNGFAVIVRR